MKTVWTNIVRCNPTVTDRKLKAVESTATAYISERTPNEPFTTPQSAGWREVGTLECAVEEAKKGRNIFVKTASFGGAARFYVALQVA